MSLLGSECVILHVSIGALENTNLFLFLFLFVLLSYVLVRVASTFVPRTELQSCMKNINYELHVATTYFCAFSESRSVVYYEFCVSRYGTGKFWACCQNFECDYRIRYVNRTVASAKVVWYHSSTFSALYSIEAGFYQNSHGELR